jgi:hypothetical protein
MHEDVFSEEEVRLLARCGYALMRIPDGDQNEARFFLECAANAGDGEASLYLGLWLARMDVSGKRDESLAGSANYKEAISWLTRAGEQGIAEAWFAISRIYLKSEFSLRNLEESHGYLVKAAEAGYAAAQAALGSWIWRSRKNDPSKDVEAVYWLQLAAAQGCDDALPLLDKLASRAEPASWAQAAQQHLNDQAFRVPHVLMARVALAARFGLSIPEALLVDPHEADRGHCLEIDIRSHYARGKRRLILVQTPEDRQALDDMKRFLVGLDCSPDGPEGNYRQRLYRLKKLVPDQ